MRKVFSAFAIVLLAVLAAYVPATAPAQAAASRQTLNLLGAVVDANHPVGSVDPYTDVTIDGGQTWHPAIISRLHPWTTVAGTNAWINCISNDPNDTLGSCSATLPVHALFRYRFYVPADFANATITGHVDVDNYASIYFNGMDPSQKLLGPFQGGGDLFIAETSIQSVLVAGWNAMYVDLEDQGGLSGINYNLTIGIDATTPMSLASPGSQVTFDPQGGTVDPAQLTVAPGELLSTITFPTPVQAGYTFNGWFTESTGGQEANETYAQTTRPSNDLTLYARWTKNTYSVYYDEQGGTTVTDDSYQIGDTTTLPGAPTKTGYNFAGWFENPNGGTALGATVTQNTAGVKTYYARWVPIDYPVTFDTQGGSTVADTTYQIGGSITLPPAPTKDGYKFLGWFPAASGTTAVGDEFSTQGTGPLTFFAQWEAITDGQQTDGGSVQKELANTGNRGNSPVMLIGGVLLVAAGITLRRVIR